MRSIDHHVSGVRRPRLGGQFIAMSVHFGATLHCMAARINRHFTVNACSISRNAAVLHDRFACRFQFPVLLTPLWLDLSLRHSLASFVCACKWNCNSVTNTIKQFRISFFDFLLARKLFVAHCQRPNKTFKWTQRVGVWFISGSGITVYDGWF